MSVAKRTTTEPNTGRENGKAKAVRAITAETLGCGGCDAKGTVGRLKGVWEVVRYFLPSPKCKLFGGLRVNGEPTKEGKGRRDNTRCTPISRKVPSITYRTPHAAIAQ